MRWLTWILIMLAFVPPASAGAESKRYKVAIDAEYAPYEFVDVDGKVKGMLPALLKAIGQSAGVQFEFFPMPWPDAVAALKSGKVDLVNMIHTPGRTGKFEFSEPHSHIYQTLFRNAQHTDIHDVTSISGSRIALQQFDIAIEKLAGRDDFDRIIVRSKQEGFLMLDSGKVAAFFVAEQPGLYFLRQHDLQHIEVAAANLFPQDFCFTAKKDNTAIIALLNRELATLKQSGDYDDIIRPWLIAPPNWLHAYKQEMAAGIILLILLVIGFILWNTQLRRTVRRQMQTLHEEHDRLAESEIYRRTLYEQSPIGLALCRMDGCLVDINQAYADILGRPVEETLQLCYWDITPDGFAEDEQRQMKLLEDNGRYGPYEKEYLHKDGHRVNVRLNGVILERNGERYIWSSVEDISKEKMQEAMLAEQTEEMQAVIENAPSGILVIDREASIRNANPSACVLFGYDKAEFIGMSLHALVPDDIRAKHPPLFRDEVMGNTHQIMGKTRELRAQRQDGSQFPCTVIVSNFTVMGNRIFSVIVHDLSEEREMQARVEHMQRLESLGVLAGGIAHDFNNILTAIMGNAAMAGRRARTNPQETQQYLANIVNSSEKAAELCKQMLAYSGKGKFVVKAIDISDMVAEVTQLLEISIAKNVVLKYHLTEQLPAVEADVAQMQQVMMNLVINASDAIGEKSGVISITTGVMHADAAYLASTVLDDQLPEGRYAYLEVSDTGCGMDKKTQTKLFEPFFTTKFTGHGLGMSAVLGIVRGHHGAIKIYSETGRGSTFKVLLPICKQQVETLAPATMSNGDWHNSGTVLIVDDEETIRETAAMMLEDLGFNTLSAVDGEDGVRVYREHGAKITAVLLDMTMPKMDGKTCFRELRRIDKHVKVILSSGYNEEEATGQFAGQGLAGFIQKPYLPDALQEKIQEVMSGD